MNNFIGTLLLLQQFLLYQSMSSGANVSAWYQGCYHLSTTEFSQIRLFYRSTRITPGSCSRICANHHSSFALISNSNCRCGLDLSQLTQLEEEECSRSCEMDNFWNCGGARHVYSVFSTTGPYIKNILINTPTKIVLNQRIQIEVKILLGSDFNFPTGLLNHFNTTLNHVSVNISVQDSWSNFQVMDIEGSVGKLEVEYLCSETGLLSIEVEAINAISIEKERSFIQVFSRVPSMVQIKDITFHELEASCTPISNYTSDAGFEGLESTSIVIGEPVKLLTLIRQGVNVTFDWNFCELENRSSTPHESKEECIEAICRSDEQVFVASRPGLCKVVVNVYNEFGFATGLIYVAVVTPEIKYLSLDVERCKSANCEHYAMPFGPPLPDFMNYNHFDSSLPPWEIASMPTPTAADLFPQSTLAPGSYYLNTKICFHANVYISVRKNISTVIRFGDGHVRRYSLDNAPSYFVSSYRTRRNIEDVRNPYVLNSTAGVMSMRSNYIFPFKTFGDEDNERDMSVCYKEGCMLSVYFSHIYQSIGVFHIEMEVSNSTHQISTSLSNPITILSKDISTGGIICKNITATWKIIKFSIPGVRDEWFTWKVSSMNESNVTSSQLGSKNKRIIGSSTLLHVFTKPGMYKIQLINIEDLVLASLACYVTVEDSINGVVLNFSSSESYFKTNHDIIVDINIKNGTNFEISWIWGNEVIQSSTRFNAPYSAIQTLRSSTTGCKTLSVTVSNNVSSVQKSLKRLICFEEEISNLELIVPDQVKIGRSMNITVRTSSGSNMHLHLKLNFSSQGRFEFFEAVSENRTGPSVLKFLSKPFLEPGVCFMTLRVQNYISLKNKSASRSSITKRVPIEYELGDVGIQILQSKLHPEDPSQHSLSLLVEGEYNFTNNVLYKWTYPNHTDTTRSSVYYTSSPVVELHTRCNDSFSNVSCALNLSVTDGISIANTSINIYNMASALQPSRMNHKFIIPIQKEVSFHANCTSFGSCCNVLIDSNASSLSIICSVAEINYTFTSLGWHNISLTATNESDSTETEISYVFVQENLQQLQIEGSSVISLDENPFGRWNAVVNSGSNLIYEWKIMKHVTNGYFKEDMKISSLNHFSYKFNETGQYEIVLDVFNDISRMQTSQAVHVRMSELHLNITVKPAYHGTDTIFFLHTNATGSFTLFVRWSLYDIEYRFVRDDLSEIDSTNNITNITSFALRKRYLHSGLHRYRFSFRWNNGYMTVTKNLSGDTRVFLVEELPPVILALRKNDTREELTQPYVVRRDEGIVINLQLSDLISSLQWTIHNNHTLIGNESVSSISRIHNFPFIATELGTYRCTLIAHPGNFTYNIKIVAMDTIKHLTLDRPYLLLLERFSNFCELGKTSQNISSSSVLFTVKSDSVNATFQFQFRPIGSHFVDDDIIYAIANSSNAIFSESSVYKHAAEALITFQREAAYNVSVIAFAPAQVLSQKDQYAVASLSDLFHVVSVPNVTFPERRLFAGTGISTTFNLNKRDSTQRFRVDWDMGDRTSYRDAGLSVTHTYRQKGTKSITIKAYNDFTQINLRKEVVVEAKLTDAKIRMESDELVFPTGKPIKMYAITTPEEVATMYTWFLSDNNHAEVTYRPAIDYTFQSPGLHLIKVNASNQISSVESDIRVLHLVEPIVDATLHSAPVVKAGISNWYVVIYFGGNDVRCNWNMGDGTLFWNQDNLTYAYERPGVYKISVTVSNPYSHIEINKLVFVMEEICYRPIVFISNNRYRQFYYTSEIWYEAIIELFNCSMATGIDYRWTVESIGGRDSLVLVQNQRIFYLPPRTLNPGNYRISVNISILGTILFDSESIEITVMEAKIVAKIKGGFMRTVSRNSNVIIDASQSFDPNPSNSSDLRFFWKCFDIRRPYDSCFKNETSNTSVFREMSRRSNRAYDQTVHSWFPFEVSKTTGCLNFPANLLVNDAEQFVFKVSVNSTVRSRATISEAFVLKINNETEIADVEIDCPRCIQSSVVKNLNELFVAACSNCVGGKVTYEWKISLVDDDTKSFYRHEKQDCAPLDGTGWSWKHNSTANESLTREDVARADKKFLESQALNRSNDFILHPDDSNFTGKLPRDDIIPLGIPYHGPTTMFRQQIKEDSQNNVFRGFAPPQSFTTPSTPMSSTHDLANLRERGNLEDYISNGAPAPKNLKEKRESVYGNFEADIPQESTQVAFVPSDRMPSGSYLREAQSVNHPIFIQEAASSRFGRGRDFQSGYHDLNIHEIYDRFYYEVGQQYNARSVFLSGVVKQPNAPMEEDYEENQEDADIAGELFTTRVQGLPEHYQNFQHEILPLQAVATIGSEGNYLKLKPSKLEQGRTYAVTVSVIHQQDDGQIKRGEATYYFRVMRGPSYGICRVTPDERNKSFSAYCFQWQNKQSDELDTPVTLNEILFVELSYSLTEEGTKRPIYYGVATNKNFQLPPSLDPIFVSVALYNSQGAETHICSIPLNVTRLEELDGRTVMQNLEYVYTHTVSNTSDLHLVLLKENDYEILELINRMIDTLMTTDLRSTTTSRNFSLVQKKLDVITLHFLKAIVTIKSKRIKQGDDVMITLMRILNYRKFFSVESVVLAAQVVNNTINDVMAVETKNLNTDSLWSRLAKNIEIKPAFNALMNHSLQNFELLADALQTIKEKNISIKSLANIVSFMVSIEKTIRNNFINFQKYSITSSKPSIIFASNTYVITQSQNNKPSFEIPLENISTGAEFYPISTRWKSNQTFIFSGVIYLNENFFTSIVQRMVPQLDSLLMSLWITDKKNNEIELEELSQSVTIKLPSRRLPQPNKILPFSYSVDRKHITVHNFNASYVENSTLHIGIQAEETSLREFTIVVAVSTRDLSNEASMYDKSIISRQILLSRRKSGRRSTSTIRFTFEPKFLPYQGTYYISLWSQSNVTLDKLQRLSKQKILYNLNVWWSDCYYWDEHRSVWGRSGCKALNKSSIEQTVCSCSHLTSFSSSFERVVVSSFKHELEFFGKILNLSKWSGVLLVVLFLQFLLIFSCNKWILVKNQSSNGTYDLPEYDEKSPSIADWLRWWLGTDERGEDGRIPVILYDNKTEHSQIFEITIQTGCWPGSGTTSTPFIILHGEDGKYEARELLAPTNAEFSHQRDKKNVKECFHETGSSKTFIATFEKSLGRLTQITIWHDHSGWRPRWFLDYVIVRDVISGEKWYFSCRSWLALDRDFGRISVDLVSLKSKPTIACHLATRALNKMLDFHSIVSVIIYPRWGMLTRMQRLTHCLALALVMLALSTVKFCFFPSELQEETYIKESFISGLIIALMAHILVMPAQLILRYTEKDKRVSVLMEDTTNEKSTLSSQLEINNIGHQQHTNAQTNGLRKTTATTTDLFLVDDINDDLRLSISRNDVVSDWLQKDMFQNSAVDPRIAGIIKDCPQDFSSRQSLNSSDYEVARCMMEASNGYKTPDHYYGDTWQDSTKQSAFENEEISTNHKDEPDAYLAMDIPILVPCEKLDPIPLGGDGPLPRQCIFLALFYYILIISVASVILIIGPIFTSNYVDFKLWIETWLFSFIWSVLFIEMVWILFITVFDTIRSARKSFNLVETLSELFPAVDAASVDEFVFKNPREVKDFEEASSEGEGTAFDSYEMQHRIIERQRSRYLRNIKSPYDINGKWSSKHNPLRKLRRILRKSNVASNASSSWKNFIFLSVLLVICVRFIGFGESEKRSQSTLLVNWLENGVYVDQNFAICIKDSSNINDNNGFKQIYDFKSWKQWLNLNLIPQPNRNKKDEIQSFTFTCNLAIMNSIKIVLYVYKAQKTNNCQNLPLSMQSFLVKTSQCNNTFSNGNKSTYRSEKFIDLRKSITELESVFTAANKAEIIEVQLVTYNKLTRIYSLVNVQSTLASRKYPSQVTIYSTSLDQAELSSHMPPFLLLASWTIFTFLCYWFSIINQKVWRKNAKNNLYVSNNVSILDILIWLVVLCYLFLFTTFRYYKKKSLETLEKSGHNLKDPQSLFAWLSICEESVRWIVGLWTLFLTCKFVVITIKYHGYRSSLSRALTALWLSLKSGYDIWLQYFVKIFLTVGGSYFLFFVAFEKHHNFFSLSLKSLLSFWFTLLGRTKEIQFTIFGCLNADLNSQLFLFGLFTLSLCLKGFFVASHQWYYKIIKDNKKQQRKNIKSVTKCNSINQKMHCKSKSSKNIPKIIKFDTLDIRGTEKIYVTFNEIIQENLQNIRLLIGYFPSWLRRRLPFAKSASLYYSSHDESCSSSDSTKTTKTSSFMDYDRTKLDFEENMAFDISKRVESLFDHTAITEKNNSAFKESFYNLPQHSALSEFERQIEELSAKANPLLDEELEIFLQAKKKSLSSLDCDDDDFLSLVVKLIVGRSVAIAKKINGVNNEVIEVRSMMTTPYLPSSKTMLESRTTKMMADPSNFSCENKKTSDNRDFLENPSEKQEKKRANSLISPHARLSSAVSLSSRKIHFSNSFGNESYATQTQEKNLEFNSGCNKTRDNRLECPSRFSLSSNDTLDSNTEPFRKRAISCSSSSSSSCDTGLSSSRSFMDSFASSSSRIELSTREGSGAGSRSQSGSSIWKSFLNIRNRAFKRKAGTLRRSHTVFIDTKDLPVLNSASSSLESHLNSYKKRTASENIQTSMHQSGDSFHKRPVFCTQISNGSSNIHTISPSPDVFLHNIDEHFYNDSRNLPGFIDDDE